jgi:hypothetical protein
MSNTYGDQCLDDRDGAAETRPERRQSARSSLLIQAAKLIAENQEYICVLRDVSADGLKIRHFGEIPDCHDLEIGFANGETIPVELVWKDETHAGLCIKEGVEPSHVIARTLNACARRKVRLNVDASAEANWAGKSAQTTIRNLSQQGAAIECSELLARDQLIRLEIDGLSTIYAKVRWRRGREYGLVFETTLSFEELAAATANIHMQAGS